MPTRRQVRSLLLLGPVLLLACSAPGGAPVVAPEEAGPPGGAAVSCGAACADPALGRIRDEAARTASLSPGELLGAYPSRLDGTLGYDPRSAANLALIQASPLRLDGAELEQLGRGGLVISRRQAFPSFSYGYETLYMAHMPLYISADSLLHAVHRSYDKILQSIELTMMTRELEGLLQGMRARLGAGAAAGFDAQVRGDADLYLAVALSLLTGGAQPPVAGADGASIDRFLRLATAASGTEDVSLFGWPRQVDFSQFKPRGHYADNLTLERYFRAMIWLGRTELRLVEHKEGGALLLHRRQLEGTLCLHGLLDEAGLGRWRRISAVLDAFVGEQDSLTVPQVRELLAALGAADAAALRAVPDDALAQAILRTGLGAQRIASQVLRGGLHETIPLSSSFLLLGQRYVVDSHVLSNLVYDRVGGGKIRRLMPSTLDVAFAALGNNQAAALLRPELERFPYAPDLHLTRFVVDSHGAEYWGANLYNLWLSALRALSPDGAVADAKSGLPALARTPAWGQRLLNAQLASWAELRHDTVLYAKQSYSSIPLCEFPDAYVDPYPEVYAALMRFAARGNALVEQLMLPQPAGYQAFFTTLHGAAATLKDMAERERAGTPFSDEQMRFVNQTVTMDMGCTSKTWRAGWYARLFYDPSSAAELDPTIADVHTQPGDESGALVGKVLHVGTGMPRLMAVALDTCAGPRAYLGLASAYHELITDKFQRLTDQEWSTRVVGRTVSEVPWLESLR